MGYNVIGVCGWVLPKFFALNNNVRTGPGKLVKSRRILSFVFKSWKVNSFLLRSWKGMEFDFGKYVQWNLIITVTQQNYWGKVIFIRM